MQSRKTNVSSVSIISLILSDLPISNRVCQCSW